MTDSRTPHVEQLVKAQRKFLWGPRLDELAEPIHETHTIIGLLYERLTPGLRPYALYGVMLRGSLIRQDPRPILFPVTNRCLELMFEDDLVSGPLEKGRKITLTGKGKERAKQIYEPEMELLKLAFLH